MSKKVTTSTSIFFLRGISGLFLMGLRFQIIYGKILIQVRAMLKLPYREAALDKNSLSRCLTTACVNKELSYQ